MFIEERNAENKSGKFSNFLSKWFLFPYKETKVIFLAQRRNKQLKTNKERRWDNHWGPCSRKVTWNWRFFSWLENTVGAGVKT